MKKLGKLFLVLCVLGAGGVVANAQIDSDVTLRADVPFAFSVDNKILPPGDYSVKAVEGMTGVLEMRDARGRGVAVIHTDDVMTKNARPEKQSEWVFDRIGDQYFLSEVWESGSADGSEVPRSKMENRLADDGVTPERQSVTAFMGPAKP
jgi:hypothetical protein